MVLMWMFLALAIISLGLLVTYVTKAVRAPKDLRAKYVWRSVYCLVCLVAFVVGGSLLHSRSRWAEFQNDMVEDMGQDMFISQQTGLASALA